MKQVTDPEVLRQLETRTPVSDPLLLRQLEGESPIPTPVTEDAPASASRAEGTPDTFRSTFLPFEFDQSKDVGHEAALAEAQKAGPGINGLPRYLSARGLDLTMPGFIQELLDANSRGITGNYAEGPEGDAQRTQDGISVAASMIGVPPGAGTAAKAIPAAAGGVPKAAPAVAGVSRNEALQAADRIGVTVPRGAASDSYAVQAAASMAKELPVIGTKLVKAGRKALGQLESTVAGVADDLGSGSTLTAGYALKDDITNWLKTVSKDEADAIFEPVTALVKNARGPLSRTGVAARDLIKRAEASGLKPPAIVEELKTALGKDMSYEAMQYLRTQIGDRMSGQIAPEAGMSKRALKAIYASLSQDIEFIVGKTAGEKGKAAWAQANDQFRTQIASRRDALSKIVGSDGAATPESIVSSLITMAGAKKGADIGRLQAAKETVGQQSWDDLASATVGQMGRDKVDRQIQDRVEQAVRRRQRRVLRA